MAKLLKKFGHGGSTVEAGYDLGLLISRLEGLADDEGQNLGMSWKGPKTKRHDLVTEAIAKLYEAAEMGNE